MRKMSCFIGFGMLAVCLALSGCAPVSTPDVTGLARAAAEAAITGAGLTLGTVTEEHSATIPAGQVVSQNPAAGAGVASGAAISLVVSSRPEPVAVPNVVGQSQLAASMAITGAGLTIGNITQEFSSTVASGSVVSQSPASGTSVSPGSAVSMAISKGPQPVSVPNVVGQTRAAAEPAITAAGLTVGAITLQFSSTVVSGSVIGQFPSAGTSVLPGVAVALTVSKGPQPVSVPNVVGMSQAAAQGVITRAALLVGTVTEEYSFVVPDGQVISQSPPAEAVVAVGTAISLVVSKGPEMVTVPDVRGLTQAAAETALTVAGLTVGEATTEYSITVPEGQVISQTPAAGASAVKGTTLDICVSDGPPPLEAAFDASPSSGTAPLLVQFEDLSIPGGSPITAWHWLFGDGSESFAQNPSHVFVAAGTYNVSLEVTTSTENDTELKFDLILALAPTAGEVQTVMLPGDVPLDMVWIPDGSLQMGSLDAEQDRNIDESPRHSVTLNGFWIGKHELTKRQWQAVMGTTPWSGQSEVLADPDSAAVYVSWDDAQLLAAALHNCTSQTFRLPSEAEWEYAYRAGTLTRFYWGDDPDYRYVDAHAWWVGNATSAGQPYAHVTGQKLPNGWGLYDMCGNAWELCADDWHDDYTGAPTDGQAWVNTPRILDRVVRGGCYSVNHRYARAANRFTYHASSRYSIIGLRLAR